MALVLITCGQVRIENERGGGSMAPFIRKFET